MGKRITEHDAQEIMRLCKEGKTIPQIMAETGFSRSTCRKYCRTSEKTGKPIFINTAPWKAHCETCLYAYRPDMESHAIHVVKGCELEIADTKKCRLWYDTKRIVKVPEWVDVKEDLPQMMATVRARLKSGSTADTYCDAGGKWFFTSGEPVPDKNPVVRWRSL